MKVFSFALAYSTQRGYANNHPFAGEIRIGEVAVEIVPPELGFPVVIGEITVTECEMVNQFQGSATAPPQFHPRLRAWPSARRAQGDGDGPGRPRAARRRARRGEDGAGAGRGVRALPLRQRSRRPASCSI